MLVQGRGVALETQRLTGQGHFAVVLDPVSFRAGQHFENGSADDVVRREAGDPFESGVDGQEAVVDRLAFRIEDHLMQSETIEHPAEEHLVALFQPMKGRGIDQEPFHANYPVPFFHWVDGKGVVANTAVAPLARELPSPHGRAGQHLPEGFAGLLNVGFHLGHREMPADDLARVREAMHVQPGVVDPLETAILADLEIPRPGVLDSAAESGLPQRPAGSSCHGILWDVFHGVAPLSGRIS